MATAGDYIVVVANGIIIVVTVVGGLLTILAICTRPALRKLVNVPLVSLSCADILFATLYTPFWIQQILHPLWEPPAALEVLTGEGGGAAPSTSKATARVTEPLRNLEGVEWVGDENSSSSEDGQKGNDCIEPGKPKGTMTLAATASGTGKQQQGKKDLSSDEERKGNDRNEPDKPKGITLTVATLSDQAGKNEQQEQHSVPSSSTQNCTSTSAAERQITKMMMTLFAVYTLCCMPITIMVIFSSKVPAEAFTVGQILAALNGALNPIVYGAMNKNIRREYKRMWDSMLNFIM
ncbi:MTNR1B [Branchiostoma lanceolatum]|uniref:MTNR1B protein n=1 Tax=Branchiostoma lanceolatum TaxID=7740 RepID=A0A8J9ZBH1_BRALA|nr:MTNR1B [Branchiostoma lanceolatum]